MPTLSFRAQFCPALFVYRHLYWNRIIPDNLLPNLSNHDLFGASSISLTRSAKYVG